MPLHDAVSRALRVLREHAAEEPDAGKLRELVVEINRLLDIIETRLAELDDGSEPPSGKPYN